MKLILHFQNTDNCTYWHDQTLHFSCESVNKAQKEFHRVIDEKLMALLETTDIDDITTDTLNNQYITVNGLEITLDNFVDPNTLDIAIMISPVRDINHPPLTIK